MRKASALSGVEAFSIRGGGAGEGNFLDWQANSCHTAKSTYHNNDTEFWGIAMTKDEMVALIADRTGASKARAADALEALVNGLTASIKKSGYAKVHRLCSFSLVLRAPRTARNPRTGEVVRIEARTVVKISPLKALREAVER